MTYINGFFHLVGCAARPGLVLLLVLGVVDLNIHHDDVAFEQGNSGSINLGLKEPAIMALTIFLLNRPIVVVNDDLSVLEVHVEAVGVNCCTFFLFLIRLTVLDGHVGRTLLHQLIGYDVLSFILAECNGSEQHQIEQTLHPFLPLKINKL